MSADQRRLPALGTPSRLAEDVLGKFGTGVV
jgi:hypothetical protein